MGERGAGSDGERGGFRIFVDESETNPAKHAPDHLGVSEPVLLLHADREELEGLASVAEALGDVAQDRMHRLASDPMCFLVLEGFTHQDERALGLDVREHERGRCSVLPRRLGIASS